MSEMDQILAMIRGNQGGMGGNNIASMPGRVGFQQGMPGQPQMGLQQGMQQGSSSPIGQTIGDTFQQPQGMSGQTDQQGSQSGILQALMQMLGRGQSGGLGLQTGGQGRMYAGGNPGFNESGPGQSATPSPIGATMGGQGRMYAGGNPNFNEAGGYQSKPMNPPSFGGGMMQRQGNPATVTLQQLGGIAPRIY